jgi:hypothetical protein
MMPGSHRNLLQASERRYNVTGFYFPVVPKGEARIRVQLSSHETEHLDKAIAAFSKIGRELESSNKQSALTCLPAGRSAKSAGNKKNLSHE